MSLTKIQKDNLKQVIKQATGIEIFKFSPYDIMFENLWPDERNYSLHYKGSQKGAKLHLKKDTNSLKFNVKFFKSSSDVLGDFSFSLNQGYQPILRSIIDLFQYKIFNVAQSFEDFNIADGDLSCIEDSINIHWSSRISYKYTPLNPYIPEEIYITEYKDSIVIRCANEIRRKVEEHENIKIKDREVIKFYDKEKALQYILLKMIGYFHYESPYKIILEHVPFEYFQNIGTFVELFDAYKKERLIFTMLDI